MAVASRWRWCRRPRKTGPTRLWLANANTYAGQTIVNEGDLIAETSTALGVEDGTAANGTIVNSVPGGPAGTLAFGGGFTLGNESVTLNGPGHAGEGALFCGNSGAAPAASFAGPITLATADTAIVAIGSCTLSGPLSGPGGFTLTMTPFYNLAAWC